MHFLLEGFTFSKLTDFLSRGLVWTFPMWNVYKFTSVFPLHRYACLLCCCYQLYGIKTYNFRHLLL